MTRVLLALFALLLLALLSYATPLPVTDLRIGPEATPTIRLTWTTPVMLANLSDCRGDSLARSWSMALIYAMPRKSPWTPGPLWPLQVPVLVDSVGPIAPGVRMTRDMPVLPVGATYLLRSRGPGGLSCWSNPMAGWIGE